MFKKIKFGLYVVGTINLISLIDRGISYSINKINSKYKKEIKSTHIYPDMNTLTLVNYNIINQKYDIYFISNNKINKKIKKITNKLNTGYNIKININYNNSMSYHCINDGNVYISINEFINNKFKYNYSSEFNNSLHDLFKIHLYYLDYLLCGTNFTDDLIYDSGLEFLLLHEIGHHIFHNKIIEKHFNGNRELYCKIYNTINNLFPILFTITYKYYDELQADNFAINNCSKKGLIRSIKFYKRSELYLNYIFDNNKYMIYLNKLFDEHPSNLNRMKKINIKLNEIE